MNSTSAPVPVPARLAATIMLLRDGAEGIEIFMVVRHQDIAFAAGALVFPGGKLDVGDDDARAHARCSGAAGVPPEQLCLRIAAIREAFEECGVLLAREPGSAQFVAPARLLELGPRYRKSLDRGEIGIGEMLEAENLVLACDALVPFAHWITPSAQPRRFDTHFYVAVAPGDQLAVHDGVELVDSQWLRPAEIVAQAQAGTRMVMPPTWLNAQRLGGCRNAAEALALARRQTIVTVLPEPFKGPDGVRMRIPAEAGYGITEFVPRAPDRKA
jgi:8-oxo-dGTP pyrophosphatase MutT (NUDIX family)